MGRPAKFKKEHALEIAVETFWEKGYEATSVNELAKAMSITRSSFYNCFKSREALFDEVLDLYGQSAPDYFLNSLAKDEPIIPAIRKVVRQLCKERASDPEARGCLIINCLAQADMKNNAASHLTATLKARIDRYEALLTKAIKRGEIPPYENVALAAQTLFTHLIGINLISKIVRDEEELWAAAEIALEGLGLGQPD